MSERLTRQQVYDRIRESSRDEFILSEMKRLGFWQSDKTQPQISEQLIAHEGELYRELNDLSQKQRRYENQQVMLAEMRKTRLEAAKKRRAETKAKNEQKRLEKAEAWKNQKQQTIGYLGEDVSGGLNEIKTDAEKLAVWSLPLLTTPVELARAMNISLGRLRFLAFNRKISTISHYKRFYLPKKSGGKRLISAPMPMLKKAHYWILENILYKISPSNSAHGFVPKRSIVTNAQHHVQQDVVINVDLKDFFPTIIFQRVKGLYHALGYSEQISTILALICTEPEVDKIEIDRKTYYAAKSPRKLPQGAPCSPAITNLICHRLDHRFEGMAKKFGFIYTRYADDLTFSANGQSAEAVGKLLWSVRKIVEDEGFVIHPKKISVMRKGSRQCVTGIVVNEKPSINRETLRKFRALLHQIEQSGTDGKSWNNGKNLENSMRGYAHFVTMVKPELGKKFKLQLDKIFGERKKAAPKANAIPALPSVIPSDVPPPSTDDNREWWEIV